MPRRSYWAACLLCLVWVMKSYRTTETRRRGSGWIAVLFPASSETLFWIRQTRIPRNNIHRRSFPPLALNPRSDGIEPSVRLGLLVACLLGMKPALIGCSFCVQSNLIIMWFKAGFPVRRENQSPSRLKTSTPGASPLSSPTRFRHLTPDVRPAGLRDVFRSLVVFFRSVFISHPDSSNSNL